MLYFTDAVISLFRTPSCCKTRFDYVIHCALCCVERQMRHVCRHVWSRAKSKNVELFSPHVILKLYSHEIGPGYLIVHLYLFFTRT